MKPTNLDVLFMELVSHYSHLLTKEAIKKETFLKILHLVYSMDEPRNKLFYISCEKSEFETIRISENYDSILFNH